MHLDEIHKRKVLLWSGQVDTDGSRLPTVNAEITESTGVSVFPNEIADVLARYAIDTATDSAEGSIGVPASEVPLVLDSRIFLSDWYCALSSL